MSTDLDPYFAALGSRADQLDPGTAQAARRRGAHRRHRFVAAWTAVAVAAATGTGALVLRDQVPVAPVSTFTPLTLVASVPLPLVDLDPYLPDPVLTSVQLVDGTAYLARSGGGAQTQLVWLDLTGSDRSFNLDGLRIRELAVAGDRLLVVGETVADLRTEAMVFDRRTGALLWQPPADACDQTVANTAALMCYAPASQELTARDWTTGSVLWSRTVDASRGLGPVLAAVTPLPNRLQPWWRDPADPRLLATTTAGVARVIDVRTGETLSTVETDEPGMLLALGQALYAVDDGELLVYPLGGTGEPSVIHHDAGRVYPCGDGLLCVMGTGLDGHRPVDDVLDTTTHEVIAQVPNGSYAVGDRFVTRDGVLYDRSGTLVSSPTGHSAEWWITAEHVLTLDADGTVGVMSTVDGSWTWLGQAMGAQADRCAVDRHHLVCVVPDGIRAWQFATP